MDGDTAELFGIHFGDGCISITDRYSEYYLGGEIGEEEEYHNTHVAPLFNKVVLRPLGKPDAQYKIHEKVGVYGFHLWDEAITQFFLQKGASKGSKLHASIPRKIMNDPNLAKRFVRGLLDTDGTLAFEKNYSAKSRVHKVPKIKLALVSKKVIFQVYDILQRLGFHPRLTKPYSGKRDKNVLFGVVLYRKEDVLRYMLEIGFKNSKHSSKWDLFEKFGQCPPKTTLKERRRLLQHESL